MSPRRESSARAAPKSDLAASDEAVAFLNDRMTRDRLVGRDGASTRSEDNEVEQHTNRSDDHQNDADRVGVETVRGDVDSEGQYSTGDI
jgi:hypothetical protein